MDIPNSISISKRVRDQFQTIKNKTGLPNNVLSRIALMLAMESGARVKPGSREDAAGQTLSRDLLFGEYAEIYDILIRQYLIERDSNLPVGEAIGGLIEVGAHKMAHCRSIEAVCRLGSANG
jgi:DNA sulfur modification protein DndE